METFIRISKKYRFILKGHSRTTIKTCIKRALVWNCVNADKS